MRKTILASIVFLASASTAIGEDYRINIADLNLATPAGAAEFDARLERQARLACTGSGSRLPSGLCVRDFRAEVFKMMPARQRQEYARARSDSDIVSASTGATQQSQ